VAGDVRAEPLEATTWSIVVPRGATSTKLTGTRYSPTIRRPLDFARASCTLDTPPSTVFSIARIAPSLVPSVTSASACVTFATGFQR
jgi:hypothetical protein